MQQIKTFRCVKDDKHVHLGLPEGEQIMVQSRYLSGASLPCHHYYINVNFLILYFLFYILYNMLGTHLHSVYGCIL